MSMFGFRVTAAILCVGLLSPVAASADDVLRGIRLPGGAVLTEPGSVWTASEVRQRFDEVVAGKVIAATQSFDQESGTWKQHMDVTGNPGKQTLRDICMEYAANYLSPNLQPLPQDFKRYELALTEAATGRSESCAFNIIFRIALVPEGRSGQAVRPEKLSTLVMRDGVRLHHTRLYATTALGAPQPVTAFLLVVPKHKVASGGFNRTVEMAAHGLLGALLTGERAVHIVALPQAEEPGHYRVPGLAYTAVLDEDDQVRLFHKVNIRHLSRMTADGKPDGPLNIFGEVIAPSQALDRIVASGDLEKVFESIGETAPEPLLKEAEAYMALFGGKLADDLRVDRFVVKLRALGPDGGRPFSVSQPFVRKGGKWVPETAG